MEKIVKCDKNTLIDGAWEIIKNEASSGRIGNGGMELNTFLNSLAKKFNFDGKEVCETVSTLSEQGKVRFNFTPGVYSDHTKIPVEVFQIFPVIGDGDKTEEKT